MLPRRVKHSLNIIYQDECMTVYMPLVAGGLVLGLYLTSIKYSNDNYFN